MNEDNRAFQEMLAPALKRLEHRLPEELSQKTGIPYVSSQHLFKLQTMGQEISIEFPSYRPRQQLEKWHHLLLLHYMDLADGTPLDEQLITFGGLKDGLIRGTKFDKYAEGQIADFLGEKTPDAVLKQCEGLGGEIVSSKADLSIRLWFLPRYPVVIKFWFADEEFPATGKMFLSKTADHFLTVEDAVTAGEVILRKLKQTN